MNDNAIVDREPVRGVAPAAPAQQSTLHPLVQAAMNNSIDTQKLQELFELQKQFEANEAEKAFHQALADFKKHDIRLERDKQVRFTTNKGTTEYRHTTLGAALQIISPMLSENGLSLAWNTEQDMQSGGRITVTCVLSHAKGHSISTSLSASPDDSGGKNNIQAIGSTVSYLERYTAFSLLGVASMDQDDDGNSAADPVDYITEEQANTIHAKIMDNGLNLEAFMRWLKKSIKADAIEQIRLTAYDTVMRQIDASIKARGG